LFIFFSTPPKLLQARYSRAFTHTHLYYPTTYLCRIYTETMPSCAKKLPSQRYAGVRLIGGRTRYIRMDDWRLAAFLDAACNQEDDLINLGVSHLLGANEGRRYYRSGDKISRRNMRVFIDALYRASTERPHMAERDLRPHRNVVFMGADGGELDATGKIGWFEKERQTDG